MNIREWFCLFSFNRQPESYNSLTNTPHALKSAILTQLKCETSFSSLPGIVWLKIKKDFPVDWLHYACPQSWWAALVYFSSVNNLNSSEKVWNWKTKSHFMAMVSLNAFVIFFIRVHPTMKMLKESVCVHLLSI